LRSRPRAPRTAAWGLVLALAIGTVGTTGLSGALAADAAATVALDGSLRDTAGTRLGGVHLVVAEEESPDGGLAGYEVVTGRDGLFRLEVPPWGTVEMPARITVRTSPDTTTRVARGRCSRTVSVSLAETREVALAESVGPTRLDLVATTTTLDEVCAALAMTRPAAGNGRTNVTPPPTDAGPAVGPGGTDRHAAALLVGFAVGLVAAALLLLPRPGARRRD
jgi:hypothetical protein